MYVDLNWLQRIENLQILILSRFPFVNKLITIAVRAGLLQEPAKKVPTK